MASEAFDMLFDLANEVFESTCDEQAGMTKMGKPMWRGLLADFVKGRKPLDAAVVSDG
jgi:cytochrome c556